MENKRIYLFDNLKAILIFFVVLGHMIEYISGASFYKVIYLFIYSFHMPLFVYISGYFANSNYEKTLKNVLYPYVVFQIIYVIFDRFALKGSATLSFVAPYWALWYLVALATWRCTIPFFETDKKEKATILLLCAFVVSLVAGYDVKLGYYLAFSRVAVLFPFFLMGFYQRKFISFESLEKWRKNIPIKALLTLLAMGILAVIIVFSDKINSAWLHNAYAYSVLEYNIFIRFAIFFSALVLTALLVLITTNKNIPYVTYMGQNCIYIFLLHGFAVKLVNGLEVQKLCGYNLLPIILITILTMIIFANKYSVKILKPLVQYPERRIKNGNNSCNEQ